MTIEFLGCALQPPTPHDFGTVLEPIVAPVASPDGELTLLQLEGRPQAASADVEWYG